MGHRCVYGLTGAGRPGRRLGAPVDSLAAWLEAGVGVTDSSPLNRCCSAMCISPYARARRSLRWSRLPVLARLCARRRTSTRCASASSGSHPAACSASTRPIRNAGRCITPTRKSSCCWREPSRWGPGRRQAARPPARVTALTRPQQALVVPRGTWHQHRAIGRGTALLYLTPCADSATTPAPLQSQVKRQSEGD